jgi:hypothetical protein
MQRSRELTQAKTTAEQAQQRATALRQRLEADRIP